MLGIDHIGSAHDEEQLALLLQAGQSRLHTGQQILSLEDVAGGRAIGAPAVDGAASLIVWETLEAVYASLGFDQSRQRVQIAGAGPDHRPISKADTVGVLAGACMRVG